MNIIYAVYSSLSSTQLLLPLLLLHTQMNTVWLYFHMNSGSHQEDKLRLFECKQGATVYTQLFE